MFLASISAIRAGQASPGIVADWGIGKQGRAIQKRVYRSEVKNFVAVHPLFYIEFRESAGFFCDVSPMFQARAIGKLVLGGVNKVFL